MSCGVPTVSMIRSSELRSGFMAARSVEMATSWAPSRRASSALAAEVVRTTTWAPMARAIFTAMCPRPPMPTTATRLPGPAFQWRSGEYVVMPAQSSGAVAAGSRPRGMRSTNRSSTTMDCA